MIYAYYNYLSYYMPMVADVQYLIGEEPLWKIKDAVWVKHGDHSSTPMGRKKRLVLSRSQM